MGYSVDTNVVKFNGWFYAVAMDWTWPPNCPGDKGTHCCLVPGGGAPIRTTDVFDPSHGAAGMAQISGCLSSIPIWVQFHHPKEPVSAPQLSDR
jgi:hypothetical protein